MLAEALHSGSVVAAGRVRGTRPLLEPALGEGRAGLVGDPGKQTGPDAGARPPGLGAWSPMARRGSRSARRSAGTSRRSPHLAGRRSRHHPPSTRPQLDHVVRQFIAAGQRRLDLTHHIPILPADPDAGQVQALDRASRDGQPRPSSATARSHPSPTPAYPRR